jgi:hypothetical protein
MRIYWLLGFVAVSGLSMNAMAGNAAFDHVLALAKSSEASLTGNTGNELKQAQKDASLTAFAACVPNRTLDASETQFTLVIKTNQSGIVEQTWRQGESDLAKCFEAHLKGVQIYTSATTPFYAYFNVR